MIRRWLAAMLLLCASAGALACPLCLGAYLRQSPGARALGFDLTQSASATRGATTVPVLPQ